MKYIKRLLAFPVFVITAILYFPVFIVMMVAFGIDRASLSMYKRVEYLETWFD